MLCSLCAASFAKFVLLSKSEAERNITFHSYFCAGAVCMDSPGFVWLLSYSS